MLTANLLLRMKLGALRQNRQATNTTWQESKPDPFAHAVTFPFWLRFRVSAFLRKKLIHPGNAHLRGGLYSSKPA